MMSWLTTPSSRHRCVTMAGTMMRFGITIPLMSRGSNNFISRAPENGLRSHQFTAGDQDALPGDRARPGQAQPAYGFGHLVGLDQAALRVVHHELSQRLLGRAGGLLH